MKEILNFNLPSSDSYSRSLFVPERIRKKHHLSFLCISL